MLTSRLLRLAGPMARRPAAFIALGLIVCMLGGIGFVRWSVDPGTDLFVGRRSDLGQANQRFASTYGGDPIVVALSTQRPDAYYDDTNLRRLTRLESDLAANPHVQSVVGPGTLMHSALESVQSQITQALTGYDSFFQNLELLDDVQKAGGDASKVTTDQQQKARTDAQQADLAFLATIAAAAQKADAARTAYLQALQTDPKPNDRFLDSEEQAATAAAATLPLPPLFSEYVGGGTRNDAAAQSTLSAFAASYGNCLNVVAQVNKVTASCQAFEWRFLLDLPRCPLNSAHQFCSPKQEWSAVLPAPKPGGPNLAIITVRLKASDTNDPNAVANVVSQLQSELQNGLPSDSNKATVALGPFDPTQCPGRQATTANPNTGCSLDSKIPYTIAGIPQLTTALTRETRDLLVELLPVAVLVMLLILAATFRVRGRLLPLVAAGAATLLTVGLALLVGTPLTPAVIAGVPVLVGLGVDYAVQLLARFSEEREGGLGVEAALRVTLTRTGPATLVAAAATVAGLAFLLVFAGVDLGPLVAIPLVAEFAGVLIAGVILAWLAAVLIALPLAAWMELRRAPATTSRRRDAPRLDEQRERPAAAELPALRRLSRRWTIVVAVAAVPALLGWALLPRVPVQTDAAQLLAPDLPELHDVQAVQAETGASNEVDLFVEGDVAADPKALDYQLDLDWLARCRTGGQVVTTFSMASLLDELLNPSARASGAPSGTAYPCGGKLPSQVRAAATPTPSPSAAPSASPTPSPGASSPAASPTGTGMRIGGQPAFRAAVAPRAVLRAASAGTPAATPAPATSAPAGPAAPAGTASPSPNPSSVSPQQLANLQLPPASVCALRLFSRIAASVVGPNGADGIQPPPATSGAPGTEPCPPPNVLLAGQNVGLYQDPTPVTVDNTRIPMTIAPASVADQAALIDSLATQRSSLTTPGSVSAVHPAGLVALAAQAYDTITGRALLLNVLPLLVVAVVLLAIHREPRRALLPVLPAALAAGWGPLLILMFGRLPGDAGRVLGSLTPLTVVLGALVVALGTEFGVVIIQRFYEERSRELGPDEAAEAAVGATGKAVLISAGTLAAGFGVLALSGALTRGTTSRLGFDWHSLPIVSAFGLTVVLDLALAVLAVFAVMLPLAVALEKRAPSVVAEAAPAEFRATTPAPARARGATTAKPQPVVTPEEFVVEEEEEPAAVIAVDEPVEEPVEAEEEAEGVEDEVAVDAPVIASERPPARLPGLSGRRRPAAAEQHAPSAAAPEAPRPARLPGGVTRRRAPAEPLPSAAAPLPSAAAPAQPQETTPRRPPGGIVGRRRPPAAEAPPAAPAVVDEPPAVTAAAPAPDTAGDPAPAPATPPRRRRRRPPPHVRRQQGPSGPPQQE